MASSTRRRNRTRTQKGARTPKIMDSHLEEMLAEGQGLWRISIYGVTGAAETLLAAFNGDPEAITTIRAMDQLVKDVALAGRTTKPKLCLLCSNQFDSTTLPAAWVLVQPHTPTATNALGNGICMDCWNKYPSTQALSPLVTAAYQKLMLRDMRVLGPISKPGNA